MPALMPAAVVEQTMLLPIAGRPAPGVQGAPQLQIFAAVLNDSPYFHTGQSEQDQPTLPADWRAGYEAADAAHRATAALATAGPDRATSSGLPVRRPGQFAIPVAAPAAATIPAQRDRAATRRGMAAMTQIAARKSPSASPRQIG